MLTTLDCEGELLLGEMTESGSTRAGELVFVRKELSVACLRSWMGEEERLKVVVHGVSDQNSAIQ